MSDTPPEKAEKLKSPDVKPEQEQLSPSAKRSIQGVEPIEPGQPVGGKPELISADPALQADLNEWQRTHDPANWEYRTGSPHADYQAAKDLEKAQRQHELGEQAATADSLGDAVDTTLKARQDSNATDGTPMDQYFREKHGAQPYTTDAYPKESDETKEGR